MKSRMLPKYQELQKDHVHKLYFKNGYAQNEAFKRNPSKLINSLICTTAFQQSLKFMGQGFNVWLILILVLSIVFESRQQLYLCVLQFVFNAFLHSLRIWQQIIKAKAVIDEYYAQQVYVIQWDPRCHISKTPKRDVQVGSLIFLKRHQPVPMTVLILNSQEEKLMVQTWQQDGITHLTSKSAIKLTSTSNQDAKQFIYFKRILTGKIEFDPVDTSKREFNGFIKLQKDPKGEYLDYSNVITQSSVIYNTDWVVGIIISNDDEDVRRLWNTLFKNRNNEFHSYLERFAYLFGLLYLIQLASSITIIVKFQIIRDISYFSILSRIFQSLAFVHPTFVLGLIELVYQRFAYIFKDSQDIIVSHPSEILNLSKVHHCIYDKTGTLTNINTILGGVICGQHFYSLKAEENLVRQQTKQFKLLRTQINNRSAMQQIEEEDDEIDLPKKQSLEGFGMSIQKSERVIPMSFKMEEEMLSFNPEEAILQDDENYSRHQIVNFNTHFTQQEIKQQKIPIISRQQSSHEEPSSPERDMSRSRYNVSRRTFKKKPKTPAFTGDEIKWGEESQIQDSENQEVAEPSIEEESDTERKDIKDLIKQGHLTTNEFMRALILCQDVKTKSTKKISKNQDGGKFNMNISQLIDLQQGQQQLFFNETAEEYQESVIKYAKLYGFEFTCAGVLNKKTCYEISAKGLQERYIMLKKFYKDDCFSVILEQAKQEVQRAKRNSSPRGQKLKMKLYVKSENLELLEHCNLTQAKRINLDKLINHYQQNGFRFVVYAGRTVDNVNFIKDENSSQVFYSTQQDQSVHSTYQSTVITWDKDLYENLQYLGIICLKEEYNHGALTIAKQLKSFDIPQWVLSGDKKMQTISTAYQVGILQKDNMLLRIDEEDEDKLKLQIKAQLLFIRKQLLKETEQHQSSEQQHIKQLFQSQPVSKSFNKKTTLDENLIQLMKKRGEEPLQKVCLLLNGKCIALIFGDEYMKSHFLFIALILKTLIAYDCCPNDKQLISRSVSEVQGSLLTISDSIDDFEMDLHSQANIQYINQKKKLKLAYANIQVSNLQHLRQLILYFAKILPMHLCAVVVFSVKVSLCQYILYVMHVCIRKVVYIEESIVYLISLQLQVLIIAVLFVNYDDRSDQEQMQIMLPQSSPSSYKFLNNNYRWLQEFFYEIMISSSLIAVINIFIFTFMTLACIDTYSISHVMYLYQSFHVLGFGLSYMLHNNAPLRSYLWSVLLTLVLLIISFSIEIGSERTHLLRIFFRWQFVIGLFSAVLVIVTIDSLIKNTREQFFAPTVIRDFLAYVEKQASTSRRTDDVSYDHKHFHAAAHAKISKKFFETIKQLFNNINIDPFIRSLFENGQRQSFTNEYQFWSLNFYNQHYEKVFREQKLKTYFKEKRYIVFILLLVMRLGSLAAWSQFNSNYALIFNVIWAALMIIWFSMFVMTWVNYGDQLKFARIEAYILIPLILICDVCESVNDPSDVKQFYYSSFGQIFYYQFLAWDVFPPPLAYPMVLTTFFEVIYAVKAFQFYVYYCVSNPFFRMEFIIIFGLLVIISCLTTYTYYNFQRLHRLSFLFDESLKSQQEQTNQIVKLLLPAFIYEKIEMDEDQIEENQGSVSIIFLEICHFDKILQSKQRAVVSYLDDIFRVFDKICLQYGVQKIETVGKTYMACAGLKALEAENTKDGINSKKKNETLIALDLSFDFFRAISEFKYQFQGKAMPLSIKIGIHYGQVIAGVIGYHKPQFSLIGDTVNTASRMCSTGDEGRLTISEQAFDRVKDSDYLFIEHKVEAKGKGVLNVYQVSRRKFSNKKRHSLPQPLKEIPVTSLKGFKRGTQLHNIKEVTRSTQLGGPPSGGGGRRSRVFSSKLTQNAVLIRGKKKDNHNNNSDNQKSGYLSIPESSMNDKRAKSQIITKTDYTQEWEEQKEDEIEIKAIEWFPENRMMGFNEQEPEPIVERVERPVKQVQNILRYQKWTLEYESKQERNDPEIIDQFEGYYQEIRSTLKNVFVPSTIIFSLFKTQIQLIENYSGNLTTYVVRIFWCVGLIMIYYLTTRLKKYRMHKLDQLLVAFYYIGAFLCIFFQTFGNYQTFLVSDQAEAYLFAFSAVNQSSMKFKYMMLYLILSQSAWLVLLAVYGYNSLLVYIVLCTSILLMVSHNNFELTIKNFNSSTAENLKKEQRDTLLTNLLPSHILTRFYQNNKIKLELSDVLVEATVLFADISGFTAYSSSVSAEQVVKMLRKLMTEFDKECLQQNVYKVYTIGDCYVVLGINNMEQRHPGQEARNVLEMGLEMVEIIYRVRKEINFKLLNMRIGIHTGQFYGGIIGTDIVRYDIFGIDAVIANKMESQGQAARVMVSEDTMKLISNHFPQEYVFTFNKEVEIPVAKKSVKAYFAQRARDLHDQDMNDQ